MEGLNKVIGYNSVKKELLKVLDMLNNKEKYEKLGIKTPRGMLLLKNQIVMLLCVVNQK